MESPRREPSKKRNGHVVTWCMGTGSPRLLLVSGKRNTLVTTTTTSELRGQPTRLGTVQALQ